MIVYRFFRYFFFLILSTITLLYLMRSMINPFPQLSQWFTNVNNFYESIPQKINASQQHDFEKKFTMISENFFSFPTESIDQMLANIGFHSSIERAMNRDINDIQYLIEEYLATLLYFQDLFIYKDNKLIYKYSQNPLKSSFNFTYRYTRFQKKITLDVYFDKLIIQNILDSINFPLIIKDHNGILYLPIQYSFSSELISKIQNSELKKDRDIIILNDQYIYSLEISENLKYPIVFYGVYNIKSLEVKILQFLFILLWPLFFFLCILLDSFCYKYFLMRSEMFPETTKKLFSNKKKALYHQEKEVENTLNWVDAFIKTEESDTSSSNKTRIRSFQKNKKEED